jgi:hypothetical protein
LPGKFWSNPSSTRRESDPEQVETRQDKNHKDTKVTKGF